MSYILSSNILHFCCKLFSNSFHEITGLKVIKYFFCPKESTGIKLIKPECSQKFKMAVSLYIEERHDSFCMTSYSAKDVKHPWHRSRLAPSGIITG